MFFDPTDEAMKDYEKGFVWGVGIDWSEDRRCRWKTGSLWEEI